MDRQRTIEQRRTLEQSRLEEAKLQSEMSELQEKPLLSKRSVSLAKKRRVDSVGSIHERLFSTQLNRSVERESSPQKTMTTLQVETLVTRLNDDAYERRGRREEMQKVNFQRDLISDSTKKVVLKAVNTDFKRALKEFELGNKLNFDEFVKVLEFCGFLSGKQEKGIKGKLKTSLQREACLAQRAFKMVCKGETADKQAVFRFLLNISGLSQPRKNVKHWKNASVDTNFTAADTLNMRVTRRRVSVDTQDNNHVNYLRKTFSQLFSNWIEAKRTVRQDKKSVSKENKELSFKPKISENIPERKFGRPRVEVFYDKKYVQREKYGCKQGY